MDVRIGVTLEGRPAGFDTRSSRPLLLVGDVGCGKTTTVRYLSRWWLASTRRHVHVYARHPGEWTDFGCELHLFDELRNPVGGECAGGTTCLVVVDDIDLVAAEGLAKLPRAEERLILTSRGANRFTDCHSVEDDIDCLGLVRPNPTTPAEVSVLDGQGRLDWPTNTIAVVPDRRGAIDFPCHRWQAPDAAWAAITLNDRTARSGSSS